MRSFIVTANPPTPNGDLHVGHLSGPYLSADVFVRYQRMHGCRIAYLCSTDDNQSFVVTSALRKGLRPDELVKQSVKTIESTLEAANIEVDMHSSTSGNTDHINFIQKYFKDLYDKGILKRKKAKIYYCERCRN